MYYDSLEYFFFLQGSATEHQAVLLSIDKVLSQWIPIKWKYSIQGIKLLTLRAQCFLFFFFFSLIFPPKVTFHEVMYVRERIKTFCCLQFKKFVSLFRSFQRFLLPQGYYISTFQMRTLEFWGLNSGREK